MVPPARSRNRQVFAWARTGASTAWLHALVLSVSVVWITPAAGLLVSSVRPSSELARSGWWTAFHPPFLFTMENYEQLLATTSLGQSFLNSVLIAVPATVMPLMLAAFAAYALAWMEFPGRRWVLVIVIVLLIVPIQMTLIPVLRLLNTFGLSGSFLGIWFAHTAYGLPLAIYMLRNAFLGLPREMIEAAAIDGASSLTVLTRIVLPLSGAPLAAISVFQFLWVWNDLLVALVLLGGSPEIAPMTVVISNLVNSLGQGWQKLSAAAFMSMLVPLLLFFGLQRYFIRGVLAGSMKG